ncbi:glucosyltransferase I RfaG [Superficieibacter electus]|uniref:Glucosyltransferase I RfaG n=1 Tax=Superficieibacter electus TaxID=2022662 RepID=A0A2P5GPW7_9ENTR|nr:glycosyltransferase family 4 protein [Superficieibacter electus]POP45330.1 glucosyltransferase I RfaG [Superficieibacter electus]POP48613.1 glucosyltransferase I RfaG [Superficieibacter electus]
MIVAFCLFKYFPFGGLQRDFLRIAKTVSQRGAQVRVYVLSWQGERPDAFEIVTVPATSSTNHGKNKQYYQWVRQHLQQHPVDKIIGFNKMPGLDIYYAADVCYAEKVAKEKGFFYRLTPRYRHFAAFEEAVFRQGAKTELLMLTDRQINDFKKHYGTEDSRFHILPPGIYPDRKYSAHASDCRDAFRRDNNIGADEFLVVQVGSDFSRKGVDRSIRAFAALPGAIKAKARLMVVGQDKPGKFEALATQLGVKNQVQFYAGRNDISNLMLAADVLIHPAYQEAAGIVLLEAIAAGLPVLTTTVCGYAHYIDKASCGKVIAEPFSQEQLNAALALAATDETQRCQWAENARHYADTQDIYSLPEKVADMVMA